MRMLFRMFIKFFATSITSRNYFLTVLDVSCKDLRSIMHSVVFHNTKNNYLKQISNFENVMKFHLFLDLWLFDRNTGYLRAYIFHHSICITYKDFRLFINTYDVDNATSLYLNIHRMVQTQLLKITRFFNKGHRLLI